MRIPEKLRRPDWLAEMQGLLTLAVVALAAIGMLDFGLRLRRSGIVAEVPTAAVTGVGDATAGLRPGVAVDTDGMVDVVVAHPTTGQLVASTLTALPTYLVTLTVFILLLAIVRRARREHPFLPGTVRRLRALALVALIGGPAAFITEMIATMDLTSRVTLQASTTADLSSLGHWLLVGFGFFAIAEVVNRGRAMHTELDTVI